MRLSLLLLACALAVHYVAAKIDVPMPINVKMYDSHIPQALAEKLVFFKDERNASAPTYEYFYIENPETALRPASTDTYICEMRPELDFLPPAKKGLDAEPEHESQAAILRTAMAYIHKTFRENYCLWADDLRGLYWTYGLCSADKIVQYHDGGLLEERKTTRVPQQPKTVFVLGRFSKASASEVLLQNQAGKTQYNAYVRSAGREVTLIDENLAPFMRHLAQKAVLQIVTDGSICDATKQPRVIEVVYKCDATGLLQPFIIEVAEFKTCHYKMFVHVPRLCQYEPFLPVRTTENTAVDVRCQRLGNTGEMDLLVLESFDEFTQNTVLRAHPQFPVRADNRIDIADHFLVPLGRGFYFASSKRDFHTPSTYFRTRNVALFNGVNSSPVDLNTQFAKVLYLCVGTKLAAPESSEQGVPIIDWLHSFIMWFEIYDYNGDFLALTRIEHDAAKDKHSLKAQLLDPVTFLDVEGEKLKMVVFERPEFEAPGDMWNFEAFSLLGDAILNRHELIEAHRAKESGSSPDEDGEFRLIVAYNRGILDNSLSKMDLIDQKTGKVLPGYYEDGGHYVFEVESADGRTHTFEIESMEPDRDFMEITVKLGHDEEDNFNEEEKLEVPLEQQNSHQSVKNQQDINSNEPLQLGTNIPSDEHPTPEDTMEQNQKQLEFTEFGEETVDQANDIPEHAHETKADVFSGEKTNYQKTLGLEEKYTPSSKSGVNEGYVEDSLSNSALEGSRTDEIIAQSEEYTEDKDGATEGRIEINHLGQNVMQLERETPEIIKTSENEALKEDKEKPKHQVLLSEEDQNGSPEQHIVDSTVEETKIHQPAIETHQIIFHAEEEEHISPEQEILTSNEDMARELHENLKTAENVILGENRVTGEERDVHQQHVMQLEPELQVTESVRDEQSQVETSEAPEKDNFVSGGKDSHFTRGDPISTEQHSFSETANIDLQVLQQDDNLELKGDAANENTPGPEKEYQFQENHEQLESIHREAAIGEVHVDQLKDEL